MTEKLLRAIIKEAQMDKQLGLLIWPTWSAWDEHVSKMNPGNEHYDFVLSQFSNNEAATIQIEWNELSMPGIIAVPIKKLHSSYEFFVHVLSICEEGHYNGPITFVPSAKVF